jgi:hypothetical protein
MYSSSAKILGSPAMYGLQGVVAKQLNFTVIPAAATAANSSLNMSVTSNSSSSSTAAGSSLANALQLLVSDVLGNPMDSAAAQLQLEIALNSSQEPPVTFSVVSRGQHGMRHSRGSSLPSREVKGPPKKEKVNVMVAGVLFEWDNCFAVLG